jgi:hypothetical protein
MKILKYVALTLVTLLVLALVVGLCMPKEWSVERSLVVNAESAKIHPIVGNLESWPRWMPWMEDDPQMRITFEGTAGEAGSKMSWISEEMGNGLMTTVKSDPAAGFEYELMMDEFEEPAHGSIVYAAEGTSTRVTWKDTGTLGSNPLMRLMGPVLEGMLGHYFDKGLANVKAIVEQGA